MTEIKICDRSRSLEVSKKFYEKASRYGSEEYAMLRQARLDFPNYKIVVVARKPSKTSKPVFKGLTYEFMAAYIIKHDDESQTTMKVFQRIRPRYFVMENVDRARMSQAYAYARQIFKECGYGLTEIVLDASHCGVPQKRKRFFCIGSMGEEDGFLTEYMTAAQSERDMTLRDYFGDTLGFEHYYRHPRNYSRRGVFSIDEPAPTMRGVNRPVPKGYPGHHLDTAPITDDIRALTTAERAWIQTFPKDFTFIGNKTDVEQMIGNAVPVKLAEFVGRALMYHISHKEQKDEK